MNKLLSILIAGILIFSAEAFFLDSLLGGGCHSDADCTNGCCLAKKNSFGGLSHSCQPYLLPGASCYGSDPYHCGCSTGYSCEVVSPDGIALEAGSKIEGYCKPSNGTSGGPQIAVEGGR
ncbi:uncharacterized protein LOC123565733 [Mercenaria mercenaria]|uniref:uncharacterized protein LOC123565733 n=1 Tax=Mercenaria mercenaria TaxID=6596 RepID=UPI00234E8884|nr:uncharacterized protein LOC123565733 [Mercenaria mercenaria]